MKFVYKNCLKKHFEFIEKLVVAIKKKNKLYSVCAYWKSYTFEIFPKGEFWYSFEPLKNLNSIQDHPPEIFTSYFTSWREHMVYLNFKGNDMEATECYWNKHLKSKCYLLVFEIAENVHLKKINANLA